MHVLQLHGKHLNARAVAVEDLLQQLGGLTLNLQLAVGDGRINLAVADDLAHGRFGGVAHQGRGRADIEKILYGIADLVLHTELHIDDVFIAREHGGFFGDGSHLSLLKGCGLPHGAEAHLTAQHLSDLRLVHRFNRRGPGVMRAGVFGAVILPETQHHALLVGINDVDARKQPEGRHSQKRQQHHMPVGHTHLREPFERILRRAACAERRTPRAGLFRFSVVVIRIVGRPGGRILPMLPLPFFL